MDGNVCASFEQSNFQFLNEHALTAETRQRLVESAVAFGRHRDKFLGKPRICRHNRLGDHGGLRHGKGTLTGRDAEFAISHLNSPLKEIPHETSTLKTLVHLRVYFPP